MPKETMTGRERWLAVLARRKPDRVPMDYTATGEATQKLLEHLGCDFDEMIRRLHIDVPFEVTPRYVGPPLDDNEDVYRCKLKAMDYGCGAYAEVVYAPLAQYNSIEEIEQNYRWPTPDDWDFSHLAEDIKGQEHRILRGGLSESLYFYNNMRGQEQVCLDLIENPEFAHYCLGKLDDLAYECARRMFEAIPGKINLTYVADDLGSQTALMYSPAQIREFLLPGMRRMVELTKQNGSYSFHHDDGAIREILPDMVEIGIDILDPVQWRCAGMEREGLKRDFGDKFVFHGGVDNQFTMPFGSTDDVRQEVIDNLRILGAGGGYILAPCHNIQSVGPPENIVAMYETGYEYGWS